MNETQVVQPLLTESFDERVEILTAELDLAIRWNRPSILLVIYTSEYVRADVESAVENHLIESQPKVNCADLNDLPVSQLIEYLLRLPQTSETVFFLHSSKRPAVQRSNLYLELQRHQDILLGRNIRLVFWLTEGEIAQLASCAPEVWLNRQRAIEFVDAPKPEQILQTAIETSWIGTGEFTDRFDDTEEKISLRQACLNELPVAAESTSTRADLLLTLGVLHWRKGDFEKAMGFLQEALKAAVRLEDNWFEAECHNAIALVKSSQGRHDEAIDDYKQAIRLAPEQIFVWNNLGNLCMKIMRNDEAMLAFQKTLEHNQKDPVAWCGLGNVFYRIGYLDDSITAYRKAIEYAPTLAQPWAGLGDAYASVGRDVDAIAAYQKAIEANKQFILPWLRLADVYCRQGRTRDATKAYQRALHVDPRNSQAWNDLGLLHLRNESYTEAVQAFTKASELDRGCPRSYSIFALAYARLGDHTQAIALSRKSLELFTEDVDKAMAWDQLANFYRATSDYENALQAYRMADQINGHAGSVPVPVAVEAKPEPAAKGEPMHHTSVVQPAPRISAETVLPAPPEADASAPAWLFLGKVIRKDSADSPGSLEIASGSASTEEVPMRTNSSPYSNPVTEAPLQPEHGEDEKDLEELAAAGEELTESTNPAVWNEKGNIHFKEGDYEEAIRAYNKAIELDRSFGWPYSNLALTYLTLGKYAEAILLYQRSLSLLQTVPERAAAWNSLGNIYRHLNDYENALHAYQQADALDPENAGRRGTMDLAYTEPNSQNAQVWIELGNLFFKAGSYAEAADSYEKAVKLDPASGWANSNLAMALVFLNRYTEAVPLYLKSIELFSEDKDKAVAWNRLGNVYRRINDYDNAKQAYQNAIALSNEKSSLLTRTRFSLLGNIYAG
ncbi:MAG: tetratricopeptide repeat protein [Chloroflexi bacterium]|nr:tetratricopeptide repeat protein [Chloroflexota bacterium]